MNTEARTVRLVVALLGALAVLVVVGAFTLLLTSRAVPGEVWTLGAGLVGALSALLVSTRSGNTTPEPVAPVVVRPAAPAAAVGAGAAPVVGAAGPPLEQVAVPLVVVPAAPVA